MAQLTWDNWYRSDGCRKWMDKTRFAGVSFTDIFWQGMRLVFMDEHGKHGLLYTGGIGVYASKFIGDSGGKMVGFTAKDNNRMLWKGDFKYNDPAYQPPTNQFRLRFEGPDKPDLTTPIYTRSDVNGSRICVQFYNLVKDAQQGTGSFQVPVPQNATGIKQLAYFTGAQVLAGIMINHGFAYPKPAQGPIDYAHTLPQIALHSTLAYAKAMLDMDGINSGSLPLQASTQGKSVPA